MQSMRWRRTYLIPPQTQPVIRATLNCAAFTNRKSLVRLRRVTQPMRELITGTMRHEDNDATPVPPPLMSYYQDLYDHVLRVADSIEGLRDLITTIYETRLALYDHALEYGDPTTRGVGGHHCCAHRCHWLLRPEHSLPRIRPHFWLHHQHIPVDHNLIGLVCDVQETQLAVAD